MIDTLSEWLSNKLATRGWSIRAFGRKLDISHTHAADIVNGKVRPSADLCVKIASVLNTSPEEVLRLAGYLPPEPEETAAVKELIHLFGQLPEDDQDRVLLFMRALLEEAERGAEHKRTAEPRPEPA